MRTNRFGIMSEVEMTFSIRSELNSASHLVSNVALGRIITLYVNSRKYPMKTNQHNSLFRNTPITNPGLLLQELALFNGMFTGIQRCCD